MEALEIKRLGSVIIVAPILIPGVTSSSFSPFTPQFPICKMGINSSSRPMLLVQDLVEKGWILSKSLFLILDPMASSATSGPWSASSRGKELLWSSMCIVSSPFTFLDLSLSQSAVPRRPVLWGTYLTSSWVLILAPAKSLKAKYELWFQKYNVGFPVKNEGKWNGSSRKLALQTSNGFRICSLSFTLRGSFFYPSVALLQIVSQHLGK